jgi:predicted dehydrogenase
MTADQVRELCAVRDRTGLHIEEGFAFRNHPQWQKFAGLVAAGTIGDVRAAHATLAKQFFDPNDVRNNPELGGGALYDLGSYAISACNLIFGRAPSRVVAMLDRDESFGIDRLSSALLDYGDCHAAFTVATQSGSAGRTILAPPTRGGRPSLAHRRCGEHPVHDRGALRVSKHWPLGAASTGSSSLTCRWMAEVRGRTVTRSH